MNLNYPTFWHTTPQQVLEQLAGHGGIFLPQVLPPFTVRSAFAAAKEAFLAPENLQKRCPYNFEHKVGYTPLGAEEKPGASQDAPRQHFDYKLGHMTLSSPEKEDELRDLYRYLFNIARDVARIIGLARADHRIIEVLHDAEPILRVAQSQNGFTDAEKILFPSHSDFTFLTLFLCGLPGLQFRSRGKEEHWYDVEGTFGDVIVAAGTVFTTYVPEVLPLRHRVVAASFERLSIFMYADPAPHVRLPTGERADAFLDRMTRQVRRG